MQKKKDESIASRRNFLKRTIVAGAGAIAGGSLLAGCGEDEKSGVKVKVLTTDGKVVEVDRSDVTPLKEVRKEARQGIPGRKFAMVMDLAESANARKCVTACQEGHNLPKEHEYMRVYLMQDSEKSAPYWFPKNCFHCDNPLCVSVCPVGATYKRSDGIVLVDHDRCIGCKFCMTGCPYSARIFSWGHHEEFQKDVQYNPENSVPGQEGTVSKCTFCADRLAENKLPYCVEACPMGVIYFGDINEDAVTNGEETLRFKELIKERAGYRYLEELGTKPNVYYLPPTDRMFPYERGFSNMSEEQKETLLNTLPK